VGEGGGCETGAARDHRAGKRIMPIVSGGSAFG